MNKMQAAVDYTKGKIRLEDLSEQQQFELFGYVLRKGGAGSGNFGHEGRPGEVGGSGEGGGGTRPAYMTTEENAANPLVVENPNVHPSVPAYLNGIEMANGHLDFRELGARGYYPIVPKHGTPKIGAEVYYYDHIGDKQSGVVTAINGSRISIRDGHSRATVKQTMVDWKTGKWVPGG